MNKSDKNKLHPEADPKFLLKKLRIGDVGTFDTIFRSYYEDLIRFVKRYIRDVQTAENIVQDVFVKLWAHRDTITIKYNLKTYLYISVRNRALNELRNFSKEIELTPADKLSELVTFTPEDDYNFNDLQNTLTAAVKELPAKCREIFLLRKYDGFSYAEIASILGISVNTVNTQLTRAMKHLYKRLSSFMSILL